MSGQEIDIIIEIIEVTAQKAKDFIEALDATRDQMTFVDTRESERKEPVKIKVDLSLCCEKPIQWRKLSGAAGHGEYYCTCCSKARRV